MRSDVRTVQRELAVWYAELPATTPALRASFEDVVFGLEVYQTNKQMMSPVLMQGLAESVAKLEQAARLANYTCGTQR